MRKNGFTTALLALVVAVAPACATKNFVRTEVGTANSRVDSATTAIEETQERTRRNEGRIEAVDSKAEAAARSASEARAAADTSANAARDVDARLTSTASTANARIDATVAELATVRKLVSEVTLNEEESDFQFGKVDLPDATMSRLDQVVEQLKTDPKLIWIEIEGHTDNVGPKDVNERIGQERAEAVKRYLYMQHQIPLHKINVISYGEDKPLAPNTTRQGRAQNRRVVIRILS